MSVLIKGMAMPDCCNNCEFHWEEDVSFAIMHQCQIKTGYIDNADIHSFPYDCPLVEVKTPHGDLIDRDELFIPALSSSYDNEMVGDIISDAPVVIEAEDET